MNVTIVGASAGIGVETVRRALARNHAITALSRSIPAIPDNDKLNVIIGNALNQSDLTKAVTNADAVIVTLGTGKDLKATTLFSDFAKTLLSIQKVISKTMPLIVVTGFGTGDSRKYANWSARVFLKLMLNDNYKDKAIMENQIKSSDLNWTIVRPGMLTDKALTESYRTENKLFKGINIRSISRADVADYLIKQAENHTESKKCIAITSK